MQKRFTMKNILYLLFAFSTILISCKDDESVTEDKDTNISENSSSSDSRWSSLISYTEYSDTSDVEIRKDLYKYDSQGRVIGVKSYEDGKLSSEKKDYVYSENELTCTRETYTNDTVSNSYKIVRVYDAANLLSEIHYRAGTNEESYKLLYEYDSQEREISVKTYINGMLLNEQKNYSYSNNKITYNEYEYPHPLIYENGATADCYKVERVNYDNYRFKSLTRYQISPLTEADKAIYEYDSEGKEIGFKVYNFGQLSWEQRDYIYNGKEVIFYYDKYSNGVLSSTKKIKKVYY